MADQRTLLLTRPKAQSVAFLKALGADLGRTPTNVISPVLEITYHPVKVPNDAQAVIFTSANGVAAAGEGHGKIALCVGDTTAAAALEAGFDPISADGDAGDLARLIIDIQDPAAGPIFHISGAIQTEGLSETLAQAGFEYTRSVGYEAQPRPLSFEATKTLQNSAVVAPVFSPRSARLLAEALKDLTVKDAQFIAISQAATDALGRPAFTAAAPTRDAMLTTLRDFL